MILSISIYDDHILINSFDEISEKVKNNIKNIANNFGLEMFYPRIAIKDDTSNIYEFLVELTMYYNLFVR